MRAGLPAGLLAAALAAAAQPATQDPVFEKDVQPILSRYCLTCHGKSSPEQGVDLRTAQAVLRGGFNGAVVVKGNPEQSLLYQKLVQGKMPPPAFKSKVSDADVEEIRRWIAAGAPSEAEVAVPEEARLQIARFEKEIQPLLRERCVACHGGTAPQADLDLRSLASVLRGSRNGPVVLEGFSEKSVIVRQLSSGVMPPEGAGEALSEREIELIRDWIDGGNFADHVDTGIPLDRDFTVAEAPPVTEKDRSHWAFRPPAAARPPRVRARDRVRTPVDSFVISRLEGEGLSLAQDASRQVLMRRAYLDLWGVPPTPAEAAEFLADTRPEAFERLLDRLLESHRYGQRWGRFWLDAAGYVDTKGKDFQADTVTLAPGMWRYRDYVISAFNQDKPWNRFLLEQLAGDEIHDWRNADQYTPRMLEGLIATGYLRTVLDATDEDISDRPADRYDTLFALIDKVSRSSLGLTLSCARCHSHKFDPIPQRDYYRFLALLTTAYNPSAWIQPKHRRLYTVSQAEKERIDAHNRTVDDELKRLRARQAEIGEPYRSSILEGKLAEVPEAIRADLRDAVGALPKDRTEVQKYLVTKLGPLVEVSDAQVLEEASAEDRRLLEGVRSDIATWKGYRNEPKQIQALWDGTGLPTIRLLQRGSVESPGPAVKPGFLSVLCPAGDDCLAAPSPNRVGDTKGYRLALAEWLTDPEHPLTARVIVNRVWQHHFGTGIVETPDNFGSNGSPPSHPELLDWLAVDFVRGGWKLKRLHKTIMLSSAYRQSSRRTNNASPERASDRDPGNRLLWRMPLRRLDAEALRDSILSVSGQLDDSLDGPPVALDARPDGMQVEAEEGANRRSVYLTARRTWPLTFLSAFDFPSIDTTCTRRAPSSTPVQSLALMNSEFVSGNAAVAAGRILDSRVGRDADLEALARSAYGLVLSRTPTDEEILLAADHLEGQRRLHARANASEADALSRSLAGLVHMLVSSNEFLYVD